ncbi:MAG TPA: metallophosphoesterase family protein [Candidatus Hydrogenedentes bacterium]|nr:metallophosphoesterase family protein [Candidatus Hydrogenedentota bacterium]HQH54578.1 metallophosphoesterase family protein [Candidatus Hydrogenedentota bacterium]
MYLAVFCAVRGNLPALRAILEALEQRGIETVFNGGNSVGAYPWPDEVIACIRQAHIPTVQGIDDRTTARLLRSSEKLLLKMPEDTRRGLEWTYAHTGSANIEWLGTLPKQRRFTLEGLDILLCHGAPTGMKERLTPDTSPDVFNRQREAANARLILCGGSEAPFSRLVEDSLFVCPGAATGPSGARYAVVDTESAPWTATFHETPYDTGLVLRRLEETGLAAKES